MTTQNDNRVLSRTRGRVITTEEAEAVSGSLGGPGFPGPHTNTACIFDLRVMAANGNRLTEDIGEC